MAASSQRAPAWRRGLALAVEEAGGTGGWGRARGARRLCRGVPQRLLGEPLNLQSCNWIIPLSGLLWTSPSISRELHGI